MPLTHARRATSGILAYAVAITFAAPAIAVPMDPIPGNGFFVVGPDIAPDLYRINGTASDWILRINTVPTQESMCLWFTCSTPEPNKDRVVETNISLGPMYANINPTVQAFETQNCRPPGLG